MDIQNDNLEDREEIKLSLQEELEIADVIMSAQYISYKKLKDALLINNDHNNLPLINLMPED